MKYKINYHNKRKLINNLKNSIYCRIQSSKINGVGVYAIKDIPKNVNPFVTTTGCIKEDIVDIHEDELNNLHPNVKKLIKDFYHKEDGYYGVPLSGLNNNNISYYMNHSEKPNITHYVNNSCNMVLFKSLRKIKKGEELLINYDSF